MISAKVVILLGFVCFASFVSHEHYSGLDFVLETCFE